MVTSHPFVAAAFAVARKHLRRAREAQERCLVCMLHFFEAGPVGAKARARLPGLLKAWRDHVDDALHSRQRALRLRRYLAEVVSQPEARSVDATWN